jgi:hypothetical protein
MIPQADLDRALARWKSRQAGQEPPTPGPSDLAVTMPFARPVPAELRQEPSSAAIEIGEFDEPSDQ